LLFQVLCRLGEETINTPVYAQIDRNECHVMTENALRALTLVGEPTPGAPPGGVASKTFKVLRLAAFGPAILTALDYNLRVYVIEDTQDAFQVSWPVKCNIQGKFKFRFDFTCLLFT
jgi:netrin receptor unc-5